jgi:DNA-binding response OmpR family regulator
MNILLCTAEELMLTTLEYRFRKNGWKLDVAENTLKSLEKVKKDSPDLVIVDLELPEFTGLEIIQFLNRDHGNGLPIIAIAPLDDDKLVMESLRLGAHDFIITPYKPDELTLRIRRLLKMQKVAS